VARGLTAATLLASLALVVGCGGGSSSEESVVTTVPTNPRAETPPKGASLVLREIYRQFPPPEANPEVKGSAKAIKKGEKACKGKTSLEVREEFIGESELLDDQAKMVAELPKFEKTAAKNSSFVAGQLGALVYEGTLPKNAIAGYGYQGCVYQLAKGVEKRLAP
jgi:hypothetical protein